MAQINLGVEVTNMSSPLFETIILLVRFLREVFDTSKKMQFYEKCSNYIFSSVTSKPCITMLLILHCRRTEPQCCIGVGKHCKGLTITLLNQQQRSSLDIMFYRICRVWNMARYNKRSTILYLCCQNKFVAFST